jgi:hypothetical protein
MFFKQGAGGRAVSGDDRCHNFFVFHVMVALPIAA